MIQKVSIENYKSIVGLEMELGRVNVLIGENGCGKTNILEAIALGSAAEAGVLDDEFLAAKGVRLTEPRLMRSAFDEKSIDKDVIIRFELPGFKSSRFISNSNTPFSQWKQGEPDQYGQGERIKITPGHELRLTYDILKEFRIYAPENYFLRRFEEDTQNKPLGIRGEGLFKLLATTAQETPEQIGEIKKNLDLIDWFENFDIPDNLQFTERRIRIKDRYMEEGLQYIDQRSSNEGFLYLLFYIALFVSNYTPKFFAIDNIENALNPVLCRRLMEILIKLAKEHNKQVILTTHNPGILDGLNLNDDEQRLFVISRNTLGHTKALRIKQKPSTNGHEPVRLSEQFLRGYIGGIPQI
jgi:AAA15 family ATPase/GTPase